MDAFHRFKAEVYRKLHLALQHYAPNAPEAVKAREIAANECNAMWIKLISADSGCEEEVRSEAICECTTVQARAAYGGSCLDRGLHRHEAG